KGWAPPSPRWGWSPAPAGPKCRRSTAGWRAPAIRTAAAVPSISLRCARPTNGCGDRWRRANGRPGGLSEQLRQGVIDTARPTARAYLLKAGASSKRTGKHHIRIELPQQPEAFGQRPAVLRRAV